MNNKVTIAVSEDDFKCSISIDKDLVSDEVIPYYQDWLRTVMNIAIGAIYSGRLPIMWDKIRKLANEEKKILEKRVEGK